jgi:hypothetical protein
MMSPEIIERFNRERLDTLRHEAHIRRLIHEPSPSLRRRLALSLKALAERLEPDLRSEPGYLLLEWEVR